MIDQGRIDRLEERKWRFENSFGYGSFHDGLIVQKIAEIDREIASAKHTSHVRGNEK